MNFRVFAVLHALALLTSGVGGCGKDPTIDDLGCRSAKTCPR